MVLKLTAANNLTLLRCMLSKRDKLNEHFDRIGVRMDDVLISTQV